MTKYTFEKIKKIFLTHFHFLLTNHNFGSMEEKSYGYEYNIKIRNQTTEIKLIYELGRIPDLLIGPLGDEIKAPDLYSINYLIQLKDPKRMPKLDIKTTVSDDARIDSVLLTYANFLKDYKGDILEGNFGWLKEVKRLAGFKGIKS